MTPLEVLFWIASAVILISAFMMVTRRNLVHAALYLVLALFGVAVFYVLLEASFLAVVQILVYIGAIAILVIFAVMLTRQVTNPGELFNKNSGLAIIMSILVFAGLYISLSVWPDFGALAPEADTAAAIQNLGTEFFGDESSPKYLLATMTASVLLLVPLVGAIFVARQKE